MSEFTRYRDVEKSISYQKVMIRQEIEKTKKGILLDQIKFIQEREAIKDYFYTQNHHCPHCHIVLPRNGICECGYKEVKTHMTYQERMAKIEEDMKKVKITC